MDDFESEMLGIYREMEPLYTELHAYIRRRLHQVYGDHIDLQGPLPAHLLSDMWGRFWNNLYPVNDKICQAKGPTLFLLPACGALSRKTSH